MHREHQADGSHAQPPCPGLHDCGYCVDALAAHHVIELRDMGDAGQLPGSRDHEAAEPPGGVGGDETRWKRVNTAV
jgi:hypothetical protein